MIEIQKPDAVLARLLPPVSPQPNIIYIPSQYVLPFEHSGKQYVFNNLTKHCIEGTLPAKARAGEGFDDLITAHFLIPEDRDECAYYNSISALMRAYFRKKGEQGYTILPTLSCNARCVYCYEDGMNPVTMTPDTVEQTIRYIISSHAGDMVKISWFGGEPLLGETIIDRICEGLREAGVPYKSIMISNGSLITPKIVEKMFGPWQLDIIQISMDGDERNYIARKRYCREGDHYHSVMRAIDQMSEQGIRVKVRCNVDEKNLDSLPAFLADLNAHIHHRDNVSIYLSPLYQIRDDEQAISFWKRVVAARPLIEEAGFAALGMLGVKKTFCVYACMADSGCAVISPDGALYPCEHLPQEARFGDVWHGVTDEAARHAFCCVDRTTEKCRSCPFLPDCTSFSNCPVRDVHCRELHMLMALESLNRMVEKKENEIIDGETPIC